MIKDFRKLTQIDYNLLGAYHWSRKQLCTTTWRHTFFLITWNELKYPVPHFQSL